jgi:tagatose 1,6-diphosphate aldolase/sulfofructosephosphate aldolase
MDLTLDRIAGSDGIFAILAMDQRGTLRSMLDKAGQPSGDGVMSAFKVDVIGALSPYASGVLTDVEYGVAPVRAAGALDARAGLIIASERSPQPRTEYDAAGRGPRFVVDHDGVALKFLVRWRPDAPAASATLDEVARVVADCRAQGLPSVIEPLVSLLPADDAAAGHRLVIRSAELLAELRPDLLKLEWPGDAAGCAEVTKVCGSVPWTLLSAGVAYDAFVERTLVALDAGASGYIAGRAFWGEAVALTGAERRAFLYDVAAKRMTDLNAAIGGHGRPWREVHS